MAPHGGGSGRSSPSCVHNVCLEVRERSGRSCMGILPAQARNELMDPSVRPAGSLPSNLLVHLNCPAPADPSMQKRGNGACIGSTAPMFLSPAYMYGRVICSDPILDLSRAKVSTEQSAKSSRTRVKYRNKYSCAARRRPTTGGAEGSGLAAKGSGGPARSETKGECQGAAPPDDPMEWAATCAHACNPGRAGANTGMRACLQACTHACLLLRVQMRACMHGGPCFWGRLARAGLHMRTKCRPTPLQA